MIQEYGQILSKNEDIGTHLLIFMVLRPGDTEGLFGLRVKLPPIKLKNSTNICFRC